MSSEQHSSIESNLREYFQKHLNVDCFASIAEEGNNIISVAFLVIVEKPANLSFPTGKTGIIYNVLTYPEFRNKGFATNVLRVLIEKAKLHNLSYIELSASNSGKLVYERLGFREREKDPKFTDMWLSLICPKDL